MRSDWGVVKATKDKIFIEDLNLGRMSVTNDAEAVYQHLTAKFPGTRIIYMDSEQRWSEIKVEGRRAVFLDYRGD